MNEAQLTMIGYVASAPKLFQTKGGRFVTNMRVGVTPRLQDKETGQWSDGDTSYVTVTCWRSLATNAAACLRKGDPIVVKGRMRVRQYDDKDGKQRVAVEVDASTLGHDLTRGVAHFLRTRRSPGDAPAAGQDGAGNSANGHSGDEWPAAVPPDAMPLGSGRIPDDDISAADLFDDAAIEASSVTFARDSAAVGGSDVAAGDGDGAEMPGDASASGAVGVDERAGKAAA